MENKYSESIAQLSKFSYLCLELIELISAFSFNVKASKRRAMQMHETEFMDLYEIKCLIIEKSMKISKSCSRALLRISKDIEGILDKDLEPISEIVEKNI